MPFFGRNQGSTTREEILTLQQQLVVLEKKDNFLSRKIEEELKKARENSINNEQSE